MNIVLCGMMGCGKSTVGKCLAKRTGLSYVDTDESIVEKYGKISDIFAGYGEEYFRSLETRTVKVLSRQDGLVISTGGGLVLRKENVEALRNGGKIVFLCARVDTLAARLQSDTERPLLQGTTSLRARLESMLRTRTPIYESVADFVVDVDGKTPEKISEEIVEWIGQV